jgi:hypothetical protein
MTDVIGKAKVVVESAVDPRSLDQTSSKIGAGLRRGAVVGVGALASLTVAGFKLYQGFEEGEAQGRKLANVLENMGAGKATEDVEELATQISRLTGVNEDTIKAGQTLLGTFSEVAESAGDVGGVFERASRASVDLAAAGFGTVESASVQLGKALQDPLKGITALSRSGVTFTEEQKKLIESFVEANDVASAQGIILGEVEKQVKGTAEEAATGSDKIKNSLGEAGDAIGNILDTLAGNKTDEGGKGKSLSERIDAVTDSLNEFAESEGLKEFSKSVEESNESPFVKNAAEMNEKFAKAILKTIGTLLELPATFEDVKKDIEDGGLFDGVSNQLEEADKKFADWWEERVDESADSRREIKRSVDNIVKDIKNAPGKIADTVSDWKDAGSKLVEGFVDGFLEFRGGTRAIGQRIKDAINNALPDTITFFGGRDGIPTLNIPVPQFASGTRNFGGGLALVGERGPELVGLPAGSDVYSNSESRAMASGNFTYAPQFFGPMSGADLVADLKWLQRFGARMGAPTAAVV